MSEPYANVLARRDRMYALLRSGDDSERLKGVVQMIARERYAWPGGYVMGGVTSDGGLICPTCARAFYRDIREAQRDNARGDGWNVVGLIHAGETDDHHQVCDSCGAEMVTW